MAVIFPIEFKKFLVSVVAGNANSLRYITNKRKL